MLGVAPNKRMHMCKERRDGSGKSELRRWQEPHRESVLDLVGKKRSGRARWREGQVQQTRKGGTDKNGGCAENPQQQRGGKNREEGFEKGGSECWDESDKERISIQNGKCTN